MQTSVLSSIYKGISSKCDRITGRLGTPVLDNTSKSIISNILADIIIKHNNTDEQRNDKVRQAIENVYDFLTDNKHVDQIMGMDEIEKGIYLSFIAHGIGQNQHLNSSISVITDKVLDDVLQKENDLIDDLKLKQRFKENLKNQISKFIEQLLNDINIYQEPELYALKLASIYKKKNIIAEQIYKIIQKNIEEKYKLEPKTISRKTLVAIIGSAIAGTLFAFIGGFVTPDILIPATFAISTGIVTNKLLKIQQYKNITNQARHEATTLDYKLGNKLKENMAQNINKEVQQTKPIEKSIQTEFTSDITKQLKDAGINFQEVQGNNISNDLPKNLGKNLGKLEQNKGQGRNL